MQVVQVCKYVCVQVCKCANVGMHACMYVCKCVSVQVHKCECMHVCKCDKCASVHV